MKTKSLEVTHAQHNPRTGQMFESLAKMALVHRIAVSWQAVKDWRIQQRLQLILKLAMCNRLQLATELRREFKCLLSEFLSLSAYIGGDAIYIRNCIINKIQQNKLSMNAPRRYYSSLQKKTIHRCPSHPRDKNAFQGSRWWQAKGPIYLHYTRSMLCFDRHLHIRMDNSAPQGVLTSSSLE